MGEALLRSHVQALPDYGWVWPEKSYGMPSITMRPDHLLHQFPCSKASFSAGNCTMVLCDAARLQALRASGITALQRLQLEEHLTISRHAHGIIRHAMT